MDNPTQQQNLAEFSLAVRESSLKRFRAVPAGMENWRITPQSMSVADLAEHLFRADQWLHRKIAAPGVAVIAGNPGAVTIDRREQYDVLVRRLQETGLERAELVRNLTDQDLAKRIPDGYYGRGPDSSLWWILVRANLDHEIHHRGALAVYLRVMKEMDGAPIESLP